MVIGFVIAPYLLLQLRRARAGIHAKRRPAVGHVAGHRHADYQRLDGPCASVGRAVSDVQEPVGRPDERDRLSPELDRHWRRHFEPSLLIVVQKVSLGLDVWITVVAILLSLPLMLVGLRVLGETNWGPISQLTNTMQAIFGVLVTGQSDGEHARQRDDRHDRGRFRGADAGLQGRSHDRIDAEVSDDHADHRRRRWAPPRCPGCIRCCDPPTASSARTPTLTSPISRRMAGFAEILSQGFERAAAGRRRRALRGCGARYRDCGHGEGGIKWVPSATGVGIGMMVPAAVVFVMFLGGVVEAALEASVARHLRTLPAATRLRVHRRRSSGGRHHSAAGRGV